MLQSSLPHFLLEKCEDIGRAKKDLKILKRRSVFRRLMLRNGMVISTWVHQLRQGQQRVAFTL